MNQSFLDGNLAKITPAKRGDKDFCYFTVASNNGKDKDGNQYPADFIDFQAWNAQARFLIQYCSVGDYVVVEGKLKKGVYEKDGQKTSYPFNLCTSVHKPLSRKNNETGGDESAEVDNSTDNIDISQDDLPF